MKKYNKLEIIGFIVLLVGTFLWISETSFTIEFLTPFYTLGQIFFWLGLLIWSLGHMQKEKAERDKVNR